MNIERVIASQVRLGYLVAVGTDSYRVNKLELMWEMERRKEETKLSVVSYNGYRGRLEELGVNLVN
jgi:hypothetical protein